MKKVILLIELMYAVILQAQITVTGRVIDETNQPIPYANAVLLTFPDSSFVAGNVTDKQGEFVIQHKQTGTFLLKLSCIGFADYYRQISETSENIGTITLKENTSQLKEITVTAKRNMIKQEVDRYVVDVSDIKTGRFDVIDLLSQIPGVIVQNGKPSIIGKSGLKVMINGRLLKVSGEQLTSLLKTYNINDIKNIEVITNPPARYEAEGDYGMLNFIIPKKEEGYIGGRVAENVAFQKYWDSETSFSLNYNRKKFSLFLNNSYNGGKNYYKEYNRQYFATFERQNSIKDVLKKNDFTTRDGFELLLTKSTTLGGDFSYSYSGGKRTDKGITEIFLSNAQENQNADSTILSRLQRSTPTHKLDATLYWDQKLGKNNAMWVSTNYFRYKSEQNSNYNSSIYDNASLVDDTYYQFTNLGNSDLKGGSFLLDFQFTLPHAYTLTAGGKVAFSETKSYSEYLYDKLEDRNDCFKYDENLYALYAQIAKSVTEKTSIKAGFRYEDTHTYAHSEESKDTKRHYGHFFPNIFVNHTFDKKNSVRLTFTGSISRPGIRYINPFVIYKDKYSYTEGDPFLKSSYSYRTGADYTHNYFLQLGLYCSIRKNLIGQVTDMQEDTGIAATKWANAKDEKVVGINGYYYWNKLQWATSTVMLMGKYVKSEANTIYTLPSTDYIQGYAYLNLQFYLNKIKTINSGLNITYLSEIKDCDIKLYAQKNIGWYFQWSTLKNRLALNFSIINILQPKTKGITYSNGMTMKINNQYNPLTFALKVSYTMGKDIKNSTKKYGDNEIKNRF